MVLVRCFFPSTINRRLCTLLDFFFSWEFWILPAAMIRKGEKGNYCGGFRFTFFFPKDNNNGRQKAKTRDINYTDGSFWGRKVFERLLKLHTVVGCTSYSYHLPDPEDGHNATPQHGTKPYGSKQHRGLYWDPYAWALPLSSSLVSLSEVSTRLSSHRVRAGE